MFRSSSLRSYFGNLFIFWSSRRQGLLWGNYCYGLVRGFWAGFISLFYLVKGEERFKIKKKERVINII